MKLSTLIDIKDIKESKSIPIWLIKDLLDVILNDENSYTLFAAYSENSANYAKELKRLGYRVKCHDHYCIISGW